VTGEIYEQGNVAVRQGRDDALAAQGIKGPLRTSAQASTLMRSRVQEPARAQQ